jgi:hypothetical protein
MNAISSVAIPTPVALTVPRAINPWFVAFAVVIPTFMEVLDTTIANVSLRHIAGGLSAPVSEGEWVITSYLAANAIVLPISGWISARLGRRNYFLLSIGVFTDDNRKCVSQRGVEGREQRNVETPRRIDYCGCGTMRIYGFGAFQPFG